MSQPEQNPNPSCDKKTASCLPGIARAFRPLAKELIKGGLLAYGAVSESLSGIGKQLNNLVTEARAETGETPSPPKAPKSEKTKKAVKVEDFH